MILPRGCIPSTISKSNDLQKKNILIFLLKMLHCPIKLLQTTIPKIVRMHHPDNQKHKFHNDQLEIKNNNIIAEAE